MWALCCIRQRKLRWYWKPCFIKTAKYFLSCPYSCLTGLRSITQHTCASACLVLMSYRALDKGRWLCWVDCWTHGWHMAIVGWAWGHCILRSAFIINHVSKLMHNNARGLLGYSAVKWRFCFTQTFVDPFSKIAQSVPLYCTPKNTEQFKSIYYIKTEAS